MGILRIYDNKEGLLSCDLECLLDLLAPPFFATRWVVSEVHGINTDAVGASSGILESLEQTGDLIGGAVLKAIVCKTTQIIWGEFTGYLPVNPEQPWLIIRAIDSTFWEIETADQRVLDLVKTKFKDVREAKAAWSNRY